jgi:hypothetical protein
MTAAYIDLGQGDAPGTPDTGYTRVYVAVGGILYAVDDADNTAAISGNLTKVGENGESDYLSTDYFDRTEVDHIVVKAESIGQANLALNIDASDIGFNAASVGGLGAADLAVAAHGHLVSDIADLDLPSRSEIVMWRGTEWANGVSGSAATAFGDERTAIRVDKTQFPSTATVKLQCVAQSAGATDTMTVNLVNVTGDVLVATDDIAVTSSYQLVESADLAGSLPASEVDLYLQAGGAVSALNLWGAVLIFEW